MFILPEERMTLIKKPKKMAIPPRVGMTCLVAEREFGISNSFFTLAILIMKGIIK